MPSLQEKIKMLEFHNELLLKMIDAKKYPFFALLIEKGISKKEMKDIISLCEEVNERFEKQEEDGLVDSTPLLTHFVGMLNSKLPVKETVESLYNQGCYQALMMKLIKMIEKIEKPSSSFF